MKILCVIPARYGSNRLPGKPLIEILGKSLIQRVYERASTVARFDQVVVATDDKRIYQHVEQFGGNVLMTRSDHESGTERLLEVSDRLDKFDVYANIQGDEPLISSSLLNDLCEKFKDEKEEIIYTASAPLVKTEIQDPNVVKLITDIHQRALLFSRASIPFSREGQWLANYHKKHVGVYFFSSKAVQSIKDLSPHPFEKYESLEQLRWLLNGVPIFVQPSDQKSIGVDTPEDIDKIKEILQRSTGSGAKH